MFGATTKKGIEFCHSKIEKFFKYNVKEENSVQHVLFDLGIPKVKSPYIFQTQFAK